MHETIIILDFGSQYTQLIARRVRELNVYCEIYPFHNIPEFNLNIKGVILSGSPYSVNQSGAPVVDLSDFRGEIPILGICYGAQYISKISGGKVDVCETREYGRANLQYIDTKNPLLHGLSPNTQVWMSHGDTILYIPDNFEIIASTADVKVAGFEVRNEKIWGIQFHPEVFHTMEGTTLLKNFVVDICGCTQDWTPKSFIEESIEHLKQLIGNDEVILGLSGGVDSTVAAVLLSKAIGNHLHCLFIDNGLLR
ncbi:MAG TPA: glutamine-hydrolyzing GMP synthase, partial [Bacteroidales bacterium]|nr:glutamine-hydrolyzing GMP synthase [Bacteroidales bacterium]